MKKFFLPAFFFMMFISVGSMAQGPAKVSGKVTDQKNAALASVTVSLLDAKDSSLAKASITDAAGVFEIPVSKTGNYLLSYALVGFEKKYSAGLLLLTALHLQ